MQRNINPADPNSESNLLRQLAGGSYALLMVVCFTVINLVTLLIDPRQFFLFSASVPYYLTLIAKGMDNGFSTMEWDINGGYTWIAVAISAVIVFLYLLLWWLSRKHSYPLWIALGLFLFDTFAYTTVSVVLLDGPFSNVMDLFIHGWVLWMLFAAIRAGVKLRKRKEGSPERGAVSEAD